MPSVWSKCIPTGRSKHCLREEQNVAIIAWTYPEIAQSTRALLANHDLLKNFLTIPFKKGSASKTRTGTHHQVPIFTSFSTNSQKLWKTTSDKMIKRRANHDYVVILSLSKIIEIILLDWIKLCAIRVIVATIREIMQLTRKRPLVNDVN